MAIKFKEDRVKAEIVVAREAVKDVVSGDLELKNHNTGTQINEILDVKARVRDVKTVIVDGGVEINGVIQIDCLYNAEETDGESDQTFMATYHQDDKIEFENFIDIPEAEAGMNILLNVRVADITYEVLETNVLEVAVTLIKFCALSEVKDIKFLTQITGLPKEQVVEQQLRVEEWIADDSIKATVAKEVTLKIPMEELEDVLAISGEIVKTEYKTMDNAVASEGIMEVHLVYRGDNDLLEVIDDRIEFTNTIDLLGVEPGMTVYANYKITDLQVQKISEDRIRIVGQVECYAKVTKPRRLNVVTNILNDRVDTEKMVVMLQEGIGRNRAKDSIVHRVNVPPTRPDIVRPLQCYGRVKDLTTMVNDGGVVVEGTLEGTAYYTAEENYCDGELTVCLKDYFDFDSYITVEECEEGMDVYVETDVRRTSFHVLNDRTLEMNIVLEKAVRVTHTVEVECVVDLVEISPLVDDPNPPSYIIYVVQKGDTVWKVARRYKVNMDALIEFNNLENPDKLEIGQKLAIPKSLIGATG